MQRFLICLLFFTGISMGISRAQSPVQVHFSQPFYVSGEVVWYKLYLPENFPSGPKVVTVSLLDAKDRLVEQSYLRRSSGSVLTGFYQIPFDWKSGVYRLIFSATKADGHEPLILAETRLPIYDDLEEELGNVEGPNPQVAGKGEGFTLQVNIEMSQDVYEPGKQADIRIRVSNEQGRPVAGDVSAVVRDQSLFAVEQAGFSAIQTGEVLRDTTDWEEDINIRGQLLNPEDRSPLPGGNIAAYLSRTYGFLYAKADDKGQFTLDLPGLYGDIPMHMMGFVPEDILVELDQKPATSPLKQVALPYPNAVKQYLALSRKRKLIYQLYGLLEQSINTIPANIKFSKPEADSPIPLDEYEAFPDLATMVRDLSIPVRFREWEKDRLGVRIFDPSQTLRSYYTDRPIFIVDGMLTRDDHYIANLDITKVEHFDLFYAFERLLKLYGPIARYGAIRIESRNRNIAVPEQDQKNRFDLKGFPAEVSYPVMAQSFEKVPVQLRPVLYWQPEAQTNAEGILEFTIPLTDDQSRFEVEVLVQDKAGRRGQGQVYFSVKAGEK